MKSLFNRQAERFVRERKRYKRWMAMFLCLAIVVSSGTYASLTWEGRALDEAAEVQAVEVEAEAATADGNGAEVNMIGADGNGDVAGEDGEDIGAPLINGENGGETEAANGSGGKEDTSNSATTDNGGPAGSLGGGKDGIEETPGETLPEEEPQTEEKESVSGNDTPEETEISEDLSGNDLKEIPPFEIMDLNEYGSMRAMLYSYALTFAQPDSLQAAINEAAENGDSYCELTLDHDTAENLVILDGVTVMLDLNGHALSPERRIYNGSLSTITVYGELILKDSAGGDGSITKGGNVADDVRGITVGDGGHLTLESGTIKDFDVEGNGGGVLVENKGTCAIEGGTFTNNTAKYYGGGLFAYDAGSVTISDAIWSNNHAECGGAIAFNKATGDSYTFKNTSIMGNEASEKGGGIYVEAAMRGVSFENIRVENNNAKSGGGMYFTNGAAVTMPENSITIKGNRATAGNGGGLWLGEGSDFTLTSGNIITENTAGGVNGAAGGGAYLYRKSNVTILGGEISKNSARTHGGGLALASENKYGSSFLMTGGEIKDNTVGEDGVSQMALYGGGFYIGEYTENVRITGGEETSPVRITGNKGASHGGGFYIGGNGKGFSLEGGTISGNSASAINVESYGGGFYCGTVMTMTDAIITENYAKNNGGGAATGTITLEGGEIYSNKSGGRGGALNTGRLTMNGGEIYDNTCVSWGGGVSASTFIMNGGEIHHNTATSSWGGGVMCWSGGGVTINDGSIHHNTVAGPHGGGLATNRTFVMHGGEIYENSTNGSGGGVYLEEGYNSVMDGGKIYGNRASSGAGGGVACVHGFFRMTGGEISGNRSTGNGGGIYAWSNINYRNNCGGKRLEVSGTAKITGNTANNNGGGIGAEWGSVMISGGEITDNTALGNGTNSGYGGGIIVGSSVSKFEITKGAVIRDNVAKRQGKDIRIGCNYVAGKDRCEFTICPADQMDGGTKNSYWLDETAADGEESRLTGEVNNGDFLGTIEKETLEDGSSDETKDSQAKTLVCSYTFYAGKEGIVQVDDRLYPSVQAAVDDIVKRGEEKQDKTVTMLGDSRETVVIPGGVKATLDLNGHALKGELGSVIEVEENADLTICDSSEEKSGEIREGKGKKVSGAPATVTYGGGLYVAGRVTLLGGTIKDNDTADSFSGSGIYIAKQGAVVMEDGAISGNKGCGVLVYDSREALTTADVTASFTMKGGEITGNNYGGIYLYSKDNKKVGARIEIAGGVIAGNSNVSGNGGGIHVRGGSLTISGGEIRENTGSAKGGAIYGNNAVISIENGRIQENKSRDNGGAIYVEGSSTCTISGKTVISGNVATNQGGAIWTNNCTVTIEDSEIRENTAVTGGAIYAQGDSKITIDKGAAITGNRASSTGGGIHYSTTTSRSNFKLSKDAAVYGNETDLHPSDLYFVAKSNITGLPEIKEIKAFKDNYVCWFDYRSHGAKTAAEILNNRQVAYDLAASAEMTETGEVCQIDTGKTDENGQPVIKKYASFAAAIADVRIMAAEEGNQEKNFVIELLMDHAESVEIPGGLKVTVDLGNHTLTPVKTEYTFYVRNNADFTLRNGTLSAPAGENAVSRGIRVAAGTSEALTSVASLKMENVTLDGFKGNTYGGGIYATGYWEILLNNITVQNCSATERGGGIYASRTGQRLNRDFVMRDSIVTGCSAKEYGGGVYVGIEGSYDSKKYGVCNITVEDCRIRDNSVTGIYGGGMYLGAAGTYIPLKLTISSSDTGNGTDSAMLIAGNEAKSGGGLLIDKVKETVLENVEVKENHTTAGGGGGIYVIGSNKVTFNNVNSHHNTTSGGGSAGASITAETVTIIDSNFNDNRVLGGSSAGGLWVKGKLTMTGGEICRNSATNAGGLYLAGNSLKYPIVLTGVEISDNRALNSYGGVQIDALNSDWGAREYTFENCTITENTCDNGNGGGIGLYYVRNGIVKFHGTMISGNKSGRSDTNEGRGNGGGIWIYQNDSYPMEITLDGKTEISGNHADYRGGGIYGDTTSGKRGQINIKDVRISDNTAGTYGGGIYLLTMNMELSGGEIIGNTASYGGGIYINRWYWNDNGVTKYYNGRFHMTGGKIMGNMALTNGGGLYLTGYNDDYIEMDGGEITDNRANGYGGGVCQGGTSARFQLLKGGKIYDNEASLGQDVYAFRDAGKETYLNLIPAADMFAADDQAHVGAGWLDETTNDIITTEIQGKLTRFYALTLLYDNSGKTVAMIGEREFTSVQRAVDAIRGALKDGTPFWEGENPEIRMVADSVENVVIPGEMKLTLNLNGKKLQGHSTAISCQGNLTIVDDRDPGVETTGTITGFGVEAGGGVYVHGNGFVTLKSGQIANCYGGTADKANKDGSKGGAAVCVDAGTFVLDGGSLNHNNASCGSAVLVRNRAGKFRMISGTVENNTTTNYGAIYIDKGSAEIAGGSIRNNTALHGGGIYLKSGSLNIFGTKDNKVVIEGNKATEKGGGIAVSDGTANLKNVEITNNVTTGAKKAAVGVDDVSYSAGGGIYQYVGRLDIGEGVSIKNNSAVRGGGIYQRGAGTIHMIDGVISKNTAQMGGGVAQSPQAACVFLLMGGGVYDNISKLSSSGNDFYSRYEGTDKDYKDGKYTVPKLTVINAASMENDNYNAWKDDAYIKVKGDPDYERLGEKIGDGQYIVAEITQAYNVELTASHYETEVVKTDLLTDMEAGSIKLEQIDKKGNKVKTATGTSIWDTGSESAEKTAEDMLKSDAEHWIRMEDRPYGTEGRNYIRYIGDDERYRVDRGDGAGVYEPDQMVEWTPGDDSKAQNTLVRTFDTVTYPFNITMVKKPEISDGVSGNDVSGNNAPKKEIPENAYYRLWLEVRLPVSTDEADFVTDKADAFADMDHYVMETEFDGNGNSVRVMRGYWNLKAKEYPDGGSIAKSVSVTVRGMKDSDTFKPEFRTWMEGGEEVVKECMSDRLTVSAAAKYNVTVDYNSALSYTSYFNLETGEESSEEEMNANKAAGRDNIVYGTMLGYGTTLELYNDNPEKGLKGIELPAEGIEFDLRFKGGLHMDGEEIMERDENGNETDVPVVAAPYIWAYKENEKGNLGRVLGGTVNNRNMNWNDEDDITITTNYAYNAAPLNSGGGTNGCYNGGAWTMTEGIADPDLQEAVIHARVAGYSVDYNSVNPVNAANGTHTGVIGNILLQPNVKAFSAGYVQILYPIDESKVYGNGYLTVAMKAAVTGTKAQSISGSKYVTEVRDGDLERLKKYFGADEFTELAPGLATDEVYYSDNYSENQFGTYVLRGDGNADNVMKTNYFRTSSDGVLSGQEGNASTPLMSTVYIGGDMRYGSKNIRTDDESDKAHYIKAEDFNTQTDNKVEFNYLTAMNILQKFDADAYTPNPGNVTRVIGQNYNFDNKNIGNFMITTSETETSWSKTKTKNCKLSILYAAKPDGKNWAKEELTVEGGDAGRKYDDGGVADMDSCREENLIYFETLNDLYQYFAAKGIDGKCVGILYELRDCCIRSERTVSVKAGMQVGSDFALTGNTYCTTNDVRIWTNYRPVYKEYFSKYYDAKSPEKMEVFNNLIYTFRWEEELYPEAQSGIQPYGRGLDKVYYSSLAEGDKLIDKTDAGYQRYIEAEKKAPEEVESEKVSIYRPVWSGSYWPGYIKSQYVGGIKKAGTHNGWYSGNTLLINTLEPDIDIYVADRIEGSGGASGAARKSSYNVGSGERVAKFEVEPSMGIAKGLGDHYLVSTGTLSTGISIEVKLPDKLNYQKGSVTFDYSGSDYPEGYLRWTVTEVKNASGKVTGFRLYTDVTDIQKELPKIFFETFIGSTSIDADEREEVQNGETLKVQALITPIYGKENQMAAKSSSSETKIKIIKDNDSAGYILTPTPLNELGDEMIYDLYYRSKNEVGGIELVDVLPYNGDGRDTDFDGAYRVSRIEVTFSKAEDYERFMESGEIRCLGAQTVPENTVAARNALLEMARTGNLFEKQAGQSENTAVYDLDKSNLLQTDVAGNGNGLYVKVPNVSAAGGFIVRVILSPKDKDGEPLGGKDGILQQGNNVYGDSFFYTSGTDTIPTSKAYIRLIGRNITGSVWMDQDNNGRHDGTGSNDRAMEGVDVTLYRVIGKADGTKEYEPATDIYGEPFEAVKTDAAGEYRFSNLAAGNYIAAFTNDSSNNETVEAADYKIQKGAAKNKVTPIAFNRLSVTQLEENAEVRINYNYSKPYYGEEQDTAEAPAGLEAAYLCQEISLPTKENVRVTPYTSGNWNAGFYYIDQSIEKNWKNMTQADGNKKYSAAFEIAGSYENAVADGVSGYTLKYTMTGKGAEASNVSVDAEGTAKNIYQYGKAMGYTTFTATPKTLNNKAETQTYTWKLENLALQAEGRSGKITYTVDEKEAYVAEGLFGKKAGLDGFIKKAESTGADTTARRLTVDNTQVLYDIDVRKLGELIDVSEIDSGVVRWSEEVNSVTQTGTKFGIYTDEDCSAKDLIKEIAAANAVSSFTSLPGGIYYVKETEPPKFYKLNESVFKLEVAYPEKGEGEKLSPNEEVIPTITLTDIANDNSAVALTVDGENAPAAIASLEQHELAFDVMDELVTGEVNVHKVDGEGKALSGVKFKLESQNSAATYTMTDETNADGKLKFDELKPGTYILTETETSDGNSLLAEPITIILPYKISKEEVQAGIDTSGEDVVSDGTNYYFYTLNYEISNEAVLKLPETGGVAGAAPIAAVALLLMAGGYLVIRRRRKEKGNA